jgi:hypothetical protein
VINSLSVVFYSGWFERSISDSTGNAGRGTEKPRTLSLDLDKPSASSSAGTNGSGRRQTGALRHSPPVHSNTKVLVFWTESSEDQLQLPLGKYCSVDMQ